MQFIEMYSIDRVLSHMPLVDCKLTYEMKV